MKLDESIELFRTIIVRPFAEEFGSRLSDAANLATPEARELQAVPYERIPNVNETRIFLSHKSVDKPIVFRYYSALKLLGFEPWLDEPDMPAGTNLERAILQGFEESCAAVFFITQNFKDEKYLAAEVDYAVMQKRSKGKKFAIITLCYLDDAPVPKLLKPYIFKRVSNDLDGFAELIRALPIELSPIRWKAEVVRD
ncbi:MAG TPA: toll/interleukin-1 receptor domain-containing protein [Anaerolineae bacterium]|nr:toll/interleukin-1 receptor domain-containing protein [Anaerolineae bacterium]